MTINLLFDSSFLLHRNLFSVATRDGSTRFFDDQQDTQLFIRKLIDDLNSIVSIFPRGVIGRLVWAKDTRSWRKDLIERISYKGTRVKDEARVNWDEFHKVSNEFAEVLSSCGFIISTEQTAEADDLLYLWSQHLLSNGESSIIVTSDKDLNQCVRYKAGNFVCTYNPMFNTKRFTFHDEMRDINNMQKEYSIDDLFSIGDESVSEKILKISSQYEQEYVNPYQTSISKIFEGDKSDNIPSALQWKKTDANGKEKTFSFTQRMLDQLMESYSYDKQFINKLKTSDVFRKMIASQAIKITGKPLNTDKVSSAIMDNISLMYLDREIIPQEIQLSNVDETWQTFDLRDTKIYEMKPEWTYEPKTSGGLDSDIFSMFS